MEQAHIYENLLPEQGSVATDLNIRVVTAAGKSQVLPVSILQDFTRIRNIIQSGQGAQRLDKAAVKGADRAFNIEGFGDINRLTWVNSKLPFYPGSVLIYPISTFVGPAGYFKPGDWLVSVGEIPQSITLVAEDLQNPALFTRIPFGDISALFSFRGMATVDLDPEIPTVGSHFYVAQLDGSNDQTYVNFNNLEVTAGELAILEVTPTQYIKQSLGIVEPGAELPEPITAVQVRDLLHTLTGRELLSGGKVKYTDTQSITSIISLLHTRQNMVWDNEFNYGFNWVVFSGGLWYRSKQAANLNHVVTDPDWWERFALMSGVEIAALLNGLTTINEMVIANRIKYNETLTVAGKIDAMDIEIEKKQNRITRNRYLYSNPINGKKFLIGGKTADIFSLRINRTPLEGVRALDFNIESAAYDYIYNTVDETDTLITLSPDLGIEFKAGTIIDVQW